MPATIASLLADPHLGLLLVAGEGDALHAPIDWATATEVADPAPFLTGGQLVLTTGMRLTTPSAQRAFVRALAAADSRGIAFGRGFEHDELPPALLEEARRAGLPIVDVAYAVPFSRIVRAVAEARSLDQVAELESLHRQHQQLVAALLAGGGLEGLVAQLATLTGARVAVSRHGEILAGGLDAPASAEGWDAIPVSAGPGGPATLHVSRPRRSEALLAYARSLVSLQLTDEQQRARVDRERAGLTIGDLARGRLRADEAEVRLAALGVPAGRARVLLVEGDGRRGRDVTTMPLPQSLAEAIAGSLDGRLAILLPARLEARPAADQIVGLARAAGLRARVGIGDAYPVSRALRWSYYEARDALGHLDPDASVAESPRLSIASLILASEDVPVAELAAEVLGPLERADREHGSALVDTLDAYLAESGAVAQVALRLGTHRNTVRYRIDQIAQLTGLDPRTTSDAVQLWLAREARRLGGK